MILRADTDVATCRIWIGDLRMASQTKIVISRDKHLIVHRSVRLMTRGASFPKRLVIKNKRTRLIPMTRCAGFILSSKRKSTSRFEDIDTVRIVAVHTVQVALDHRVMMWQAKLRVSGLVTLKTRRRVFPRIRDEYTSPTSCLHMFTAWSVTRFTPNFTLHCRLVRVQSTMRTAVKRAADIGVTLVTRIVANKGCSRDGGHVGSADE